MEQEKSCCHEGLATTFELPGAKHFCEDKLHYELYVEKVAKGHFTMRTG